MQEGLSEGTREGVVEQDREGEEAKPACSFRSDLQQDPGGLWKVSYTGKFSPGAEELGFLTLLFNSYWLVLPRGGWDVRFQELAFQ